MEILNSPSQEGLQRKCRDHPDISCEFIHIAEDAKDRILCIKCVDKQQISIQKLIPINSILEGNKQNIFESYPPLKDQVLFGKLRDASIHLQVQKVEVYFKILREQFEKEVRAAEKRAKLDLIKQEKLWEQLLEGYMRIAEVEKLKQLVIFEKGSAENDLDSFIKQKWSEAEQNRKVIAGLIKQYESEQYFSLREPNMITEEIIQSLKNINCFQKPIKQMLQYLEFNLIQSSNNDFRQMEITNYGFSEKAQVKQGRFSNNYGQVFLDPILNPSKKYILNIELQMKPGNQGNCFFFGIVKDKNKDYGHAFNQNLSYCDFSNRNGITNYIKGDEMQSGQKQVGKHSFEARIHLNERVLKVASLPDYSSVAELDDPSKINPTVSYRFYLSMLNEGDIMKITSFRETNQFDENM